MWITQPVCLNNSKSNEPFDSSVYDVDFLAHCVHLEATALCHGTGHEGLQAAQKHVESLSSSHQVLGALPHKIFDATSSLPEREPASVLMPSGKLSGVVLSAMPPSLDHGSTTNVHAALCDNGASQGSGCTTSCSTVRYQGLSGLKTLEKLQLVMQAPHCDLTEATCTCTNVSARTTKVRSC